MGCASHAINSPPSVEPCFGWACSFTQATQTATSLSSRRSRFRCSTRGRLLPLRPSLRGHRTAYKVAARSSDPFVAAGSRLQNLLSGVGCVYCLNRGHSIRQRIWYLAAGTRSYLVQCNVFLAVSQHLSMKWFEQLSMIVPRDGEEEVLESLLSEQAPESKVGLSLLAAGVISTGALALCWVTGSDPWGKHQNHLLSLTACLSTVSNTSSSLACFLTCALQLAYSILGFSCHPIVHLACDAEGMQ